jgi:hypothetical protein
VYRGGAGAGTNITPCPSAASPAGEIEGDNANAPEGTHPNAGKPNGNVAVPEGATRAMVALGQRIYRGQVGGASCTGCQGENADGTPLGADPTSGKWLWSDGSYKGIAKTITDGVPQPKFYRAPMQPLGGTSPTSDQVNAIAAYLWSLNHGTK